MRRILAAIVLLAGTLTAVGVNVGTQPAAAAHCPSGSSDVIITWGAGNLVQWPNDANHSLPTWTDTYSDISGTGLEMSLTLTDPDSRNEDLSNALIDTLNANGYPFGYDAAVYTRTDGVFGAGHFSIIMNSEYVDESVNWAFSFNRPVYVPDFTVHDVDAVGLGSPPASQEPFNSFQDEVEFSADRAGTTVDFAITALGGTSPVVTGVNSLAGDYLPGVNNNLGPDDLASQAELSTTEPITSFSFDYSNGPSEALVEPSGTYPPPFPLDPNGNGHSDNHGIRLSTFTVCSGDLTIGDTVFADYDGDGVQDASEPGLAGVTVSLADDLGQVVATATTDANGNYSFSEVLPWDGWYATVTPPAGYTNTGDLDGGNDGTTVVDTSAGVDRLDADFALQPPPGSIAGSVYSDPNNDGAFNTPDGDTAIEGVEIVLVGTDLSGNTFTLTTFTDANGDYTFTDVPAGTYTITETQPAGFDDGIDTAGTFATSTGNDEVTVTLSPGDASTGNVFYEIPDSSISGSVFEDLNNNGQVDGGENGIGGVPITLTGTDVAGNAVNYTTTTAADGSYTFDNLRDGDYTVVETQPAGFFDGIDDPGTAGGSAAVNDEISGITLPQGTDATEYDFGELPGSSISGSVVDDFGNPIAGVDIELTGSDTFGNPVTATTTTAADGSYSFTGLAPGTYTLIETQPAAYADGPEVIGSAGGDASVDDEISGIVLGSGVDATGYDFTEATGSISGSVVDDFGNAIPNVTLDLSGNDLDGNPIAATVTTDASGDYTFDGLPAGSYSVTETQPAAYADGPETAGSTGGDVSTNDIIAAIPLAAGEDSTGNNFEEATGSISGTVFEDLSNDAQADPGEPGISGVDITLTGSDIDGNPVSQTTTTAADGTYTFDGLPAGDYTVAESQPAAYFDGQDDAGTAGGDAATVNDQISGITLAAGQDAAEYDFGELELSTIAGTVFEDVNNDGGQDPGEDGIAGVTMTLTGTDYLGNPMSASTTTDADGNYIFGSLLPGTYTVAETQPAGYLDGTETAGGAGGDATAVNDEISAISLAAFTDATGYTFAELPPASISGSVLDDFGNPIPNASITLDGTDDLGDPVSATVTTAADGSYTFDDLRPGTYEVTETQPAGYGDGGETAGTAGGDASLDDVISGIVLDPGEAATGYNFDETTGSISGAVFEDADNDGIQDPGEAGIPGVQITLTGTDVNGNPVPPTTAFTDANGAYTFDGLVGGTYTVVETQPASHADGVESAGSEGGDATSVNDEISAIPLSDGVDATDYNFGELALSSISGTVFDDLSNDGNQDVGEAGIGGVAMTLTGTDDLGNPVTATTTTDANGDYTFDGLRPGTYTVAEAQPTGLLDGLESAGSEGGDATATNDEIAAINLPAFTDATDYNFGEVQPSSISGLVFDDFGNPIENAEIILSGTDDLGNAVLLTTATAADGSYSFGDLRPGDYTVNETQPTGYADGGETAGSAGGDVTVDDEISGIILTPGTDSTGNNFDEVTGSISGSVFEDANNNGQVDPGEVGIAGVTITLTGTDDLGNPVTATTTTDANGEYTFDGLVGGTYTVAETQPATHIDGVDDAGTAGGDAISVNDEISGIVLDPGEPATEYDFGELTLSSISGTIYEDASNDGVQHPGEAGIAAVTVTLTGTDDLGNPVTATTTTDADGDYTFDGLRPGDYTVAAEQPIGLLDGIETAGSEGGDATTTNDEIASISLPAFTDATGYNFGELPPSSISGSVVDDFGNPIPGTTITLSGTDDLGNALSLTAITAADGTYSFDDLRPGTYSVTELQPIGYGDGGETAGTAGGITTDDTIAGIILGAGVDSTDNNFDETTGSLSGVVFEDLNNDGVQDPGELGIPGVVVTLTGTDDLGNPVTATATTDANGDYLFENLLSGDYTLDETQPPGLLDGVDTAGTAGGDDTSVNDQISAIALDPGDDGTGYTFGEIPASSISGSVVDDSGNPIPDTTITLSGTDDLGSPVLLTEITAADGSFSFDGLRPGDYTLTETQPTGYGDGGQTAGSAGGDDTVDNVISGIVLAPATDSTGNVFDETTGSLSGSVFEDGDNDGQVDFGEDGIPGVTVTLTGTDDLGNPVTATATTDANGEYTFDDLLSGTYTIDESQPVSHADGVDDAGTAGGDATSVNDQISGIVLPAGDDATDYDFGEVALSSISGTVFDDVNNDGLQDPGDGGIAGVTITLSGTDDLGNPVTATAVTDIDGSYTFLGLRPGDYTIVETQPAGLLDGIDTAGDAGGDATTTNDEIASINLPAFTDATGYDFAELAPSSISGSVVDDFGNPIENAEITLNGTDDLGNPVTATVTTGPDGTYSFDDLRPGDYALTQTQPTGYGDGGQTAGTAGGDDTINNLITGIVLAPGTDSTDNNFDETTGSLSGVVFDDINNDGVQDPGESGIPGVVVALTGTDDLGNPATATATSDTDGNYQFENLLSGDYTLDEAQPAGFLDGIDTAGTAGGDDASVNDQISAIPLDPGDDGTGYNFAEIDASSISGSVVDDFGNPIENAEITLTGTDDLGNAVTLTTSTTADGSYSFDDVRPGDYTLTETQPTGYGDGGETAGSAGGDDTVDDVISGIILVPGTDSTDNNFDETTGSISGSVFEDADNDGQVDSGEAGIAGVTITLIGADDLGNPVSLTTTTAADGTYTFENLISGTYAVTETQPATHIDGVDDAGTAGGDATSVNDEISGIVLDPGEPATEYDFGELTLSSIAGTVFDDVNNDGIQDPSDGGVAGVTVTLAGTDDLGNPVTATAVTDIDGTYTFTGLRPGDYTIVETQPAGLLDGIDTAGTEGGDAATTNDEIASINLPAFTDATGYDFAELAPSSISGSVVDDFGNPIENAEITLTGTDDLGNPVTATVTTGPDGSYNFDDLRPGDYALTQTQPAGYGDGGQTAGTAGGDDSINNLITGIVLPPGTDSTDNNFDETTGSISGSVFEDADNDGQVDSGEAGIAGMTITLIGTDDLGNPVSLTTTTAADGTYTFENLISGTYTVNETQPATHIDGVDDAGTAGGDATSVNDEISGIVLDPGEPATEYDFGELTLSSIAGTVFDDANNDGIQDPGELGVAGVEVTLTGTDDLGNPITATATTDADGNYVFDGLRPGDYTIVETQPAGLLDGVDTAGDAGGDATTTNDEIASINLPAFTDATGYNFGELQPSSISGSVVDDFGNPIENAEMTLTGTDDLGNPVTLTVTTGPDGSYSFDDLRPGDYTLTETQPTGYGDGGQTAGTAAGDDTVDNVISGIILTPGTDSTDNIFDETTGSLSGVVFDDLNNDGVQDPGESGIPGVLMTLSGTDDLGNPVSLVAVTDTDGNYTFENLLSGDYTLDEGQPLLYVDGIDTAGTAGGDDTSVNDQILAIALDPGQAGVGYNFAELAPSSISGSVVDDFGNPIENAEITLTGTDDLGNPVTLTVTTVADGTYSFPDLRPGDYTLTETQPTGYGPGGQTAGTAGGDDTVDNVISGIVLTPGTDSTGNTFDETTGSLSGSVFDDLNNDGQRDPGEAGIAGVTITLSGVDDLGNPVTATTTTDADGNYTFDYLLSGDYTVAETQPVGYFDGIDDPGSEGGDASVNDEISSIILPGGVDATAYDFAELIASSISGLVTDDFGNPIENVELTLTGTDDLGNPVTVTVTTGPDGTYTFADLRPGTYTITETQPVGYGDGGETAGTAGGDTSTNDVIADIALAPASNATDYNFDETTSSLSGSVFEDGNNDGQVDVGEAGIEGVDITLTGTDDLGNPVSLTATTGPDGTYTFENVLSGDYTITETQPAAYEDGMDDAGTAGGDATTVNDEISGIALDPGVAVAEYDFGEILPSSISGTVFDDINNDGVQDTVEGGVAGVEIALTGTDDLGNPVSLTTTTDADGNYTFPGLRPGTYTITETQPAGFFNGIESSGSAGGDATSVDNEISAIDLPPFVDATGYNFGELRPPLVAGTVTDDFGNPIENVELTLTGINDLGEPVSVTATTGPDGTYVIIGIRPGVYTLTETQPTGYGDGGETAGTAGGDDTVDDVISGIVLESGTISSNNDFDETTGALSGSVFDDLNNDGQPDVGEAGIAGVEITLTGSDDLGNPVSLTTTTDADGNYIFENLLSGDYTIAATQPAGYLDGVDDPGTAGGDTTVNDEISAIVLNPGELATEYDFGELVSSSLSGSVSDDFGNPIENVELTLTGSDELGDPVTVTVTTGPDGTYTFPDLRPGTYTITQTQPVGYGQGTETAGTIGGETSPNVIGDIVVEPATDGTGYDFAETTGSISGSVFHDRNDDGVHEPSTGDPTVDEPGIEGVVVALTGTDDLGTPVLLTTTTDVDGNFAFENLLSGTYTITETQPAAYLDGIDTAGSAGGDTTVNDEISGVILGVGVDSAGNTFAELGNIISGTVWIDADEDGVLDPEEASRLDNVVMELYDVDGNIVATTSTDEFGNYAFPSVPVGDYTVIQLQPEEYGTTTPNSVDVTLPVGGLSGVDFGEDPASITGVMWEDLNGDGLEDPTEPGVAGVTLNLLDPDGNVVATTTTDPDGSYLFTDLPAGDYVLELVTPDGMVVTSPETGSDDAVDSDFPYIATTVPISVVAGQDVEDVDGGIVEEQKDLAVDIATDATDVKVGDTVVYTVGGGNPGNAPILGGTVITVTIPDGLEIKGVATEYSCDGPDRTSGDPSTHDTGCWVISIDGQVVTATWTGDLLPGQQLPPFIVETKVNKAGEHVAQASIAAVDGSVEITYANNDDSITIRATAPATLAFTGSNSGRAVAAGLTLLALGGGALLVGRRRDDEQAQQA